MVKDTTGLSMTFCEWHQYRGAKRFDSFRAARGGSVETCRKSLCEYAYNGGSGSENSRPDVELRQQRSGR